MNRRPVHHLFGSVTRKLLELRSRRPRPLRRRPRLEVVQLEDRLVLDAVGPGGWWDDGHYDSYGNRVGVTVTLHNWGPGWLEVSGGSGSVSVSPGAPPSSGGPGDVEPLPPPPPPPLPGGVVVGEPETLPPSNDYAFEVFGALGPGGGDAAWSGSADNLYIKATGDVSSVSISGSVSIDAGYSIGDVSGRTVTALAGTAVGNVAATDDVATVRAGSGSVGTVTAADDVGTVTAGGSIGAVQATGDVIKVSAGANTSSVSAGGWIGTVSAGLDVGGAVSAGTYIGGAYIPGAGDDFWAWYYATYYGGVSAGRDVAGPVTAGQSIVGVSAGRDVLGAVTAGQDIWSIRAGGGGVYEAPSVSEFPEEGEPGGHTVPAESSGRFQRPETSTSSTRPGTW